ncbi:uncharacterized protein J3D65DRAFT_91710 [Phyllosticta citribraziliensis]|uniref:Uncharacterized protein n=1 Tax=Phyllosticta citribraziliensis TaxID=989973 RepID=A0ABR1LA05_9PEZI
MARESVKSGSSLMASRVSTRRFCNKKIRESPHRRLTSRCRLGMARKTCIPIRTRFSRARGLHSSCSLIFSQLWPFWHQHVASGMPHKRIAPEHIFGAERQLVQLQCWEVALLDTTGWSATLRKHLESATSRPPLFSESKHPALTRNESDKRIGHQRHERSREGSSGPFAICSADMADTHKFQAQRAYLWMDRRQHHSEAFCWHSTMPTA